MPLTSDTNQSMSLEQIRTEFFGSEYTGSISMNQLYRGGTYVDSTKELTDGISGSPTYSGAGNAPSSGEVMGYNQQWNKGNLNTWSFSNTTNQNFYGGRFPKQFGFHVNGASASSNLLSLNASNGGGSRAGYYGYYVNLLCVEHVFPA